MNPLQRIRQMILDNKIPDGKEVFFKSAFDSLPSGCMIGSMKQKQPEYECAEKYGRSADVAIAIELVGMLLASKGETIDVTAGEYDEFDEDGESIRENEENTIESIVDAMFCSDVHYLHIYDSSKCKIGWIQWLPNNGSPIESISDYSDNKFMHKILEPLMDENE